MKKKTKKQVRNIGIFLGVILLIGLIYTFGFSESVVQFNSQCSLPSCPSGYIQSSISCIDLTCYRECVKTTQECGSYSSTKLKTNTINVDSDDKNSWKPSTSLTLDSNKCYQYQTISSFTVTDRSPAFFQSTSDSHEVYTKDNLGKVSQLVQCSSSSTIIAESNWVNLGKGTGQSVIAYGKYIPYDKSTCNAGQDTRGSEGNLQVSVAYKEANIVDKKDYTTTECSYECERDSDCGSSQKVGSKYCSGNKVMQDYSTPSCSNYRCSTETTKSEVEKCSSDEYCSNGQCYEEIEEDEIIEDEIIEDEIIEDDSDSGSSSSSESGEVASEEKTNYFFYLIPIIILSLIIFIIYKLVKKK